MPRGTLNSRPMYGIDERQGYWRVSIQRNNVTLAETFTFSAYGGRKTALASAQAHRDQLVQQHMPILKREMAQIVRSDNKSGVAGVRLLKVPNSETRMWIASTRVTPTKTVSKAFSIGRYGPMARELAIAERYKQLEQMEGYVSKHPADGSSKPPRRRNGLRSA